MRPASRLGQVTENKDVIVKCLFLVSLVSTVAIFVTSSTSFADDNATPLSRNYLVKTGAVAATAVLFCSAFFKRESKSFFGRGHGPGNQNSVFEPIPVTPDGIIPVKESNLTRLKKS